MPKLSLNNLLIVFILISGWCWAAEPAGELLIKVRRADNDQAVVQAIVRVQDKAGQREVRQANTDTQGQASFRDLDVGEYFVEISHPEYGPDRTLVKLLAQTPSSYLSLLEVAGQERVIRFKEDRLLVDSRNPNEGAVQRRDSDFIQTQLADRSLPAVLATVPGTSLNSMGQVHVRGDHRAVNFSLDGITLPIPPSSSTTPPIDPDFVDQLEVRTGSYDGSQQGTGGMVLNALTDFSQEPYFELRPTLGTQGTQQMLLKLGGSTDDQEFSYFVGAKTGATDLQWEPPSASQQMLNNRGQNTNVIARFRWQSEGDQFGLTMSHQAGLYGVSQTPQNFEAGVRQQQEDSNTFALASWKRQVDEDSELFMTLAYLRSRQSVNHNGVFTPYTTFDAAINPQLAAEGFPADATNPGAPYLPTTETLFNQIQPAFSYRRRLGENHHLVLGANANFIQSSQELDIIDAGGGGSLPNGAGRFQSSLARDGFSGGMFFSHTLPLMDRVVLNYGARLDRFADGLGLSTGQISPFANLVYAPTPEDALRLSYHRLFQAPPLELDLSFSTGALPQRVHLYEISYEHQFERFLTAKVAALHKSYRDQVDTGQLIPIANIPLYAPVNFSRASYDAIELSLTSHNQRGWNGFLSGTLSWAKPLASGDFGILPTFNDHDQRLQVAAGLSYAWESGLTLASDILYGSGYPQDALVLYNASGVFPYGLSQDRIPRFITNLSLNYWPKREADSVAYGASLQVLNLFDQRQLLNFYSDFSGTRFVPQRRILLNGMIRF